MYQVDANRPSYAPQVATALCSVWTQTWIIGITAVLSAFLSLCLRFPPAFPYLIFDPTSSHPQVVLDTVTTAGSLFKLNFRVRFATSAPFMLTLSSLLLFFSTQKFTPTFCKRDWWKWWSDLADSMKVVNRRGRWFLLLPFRMLASVS